MLCDGKHLKVIESGVKLYMSRNAKSHKKVKFVKWSNSNTRYFNRAENLNSLRNINKKLSNKHHAMKT
jgi:hypothetical protein